MASVMTLYPKFFENIASGVYDLSADDVRLALVGSGYTPDAGDSVWADISAQEVTGVNYNAGGKSLAGTSVVVSGSTGSFRADPVSFTGLNATFRYGILYAAVTRGGVTNPLICRILFDDTPSDVVVAGLDFMVSWHADGVFVWGDV